MLDKARYIVVEGPIGAGKTSLARRLADRLPAHSLFEQPEQNSFLGRFYQNMERWALPTQLHFLFQRIDQLRNLEAEGMPGPIVSDFRSTRTPSSRR
jgi:deoxyguanosine kinase